MARAKLATDRLLECVCVFMCVYVCVFMYVFVCMFFFLATRYCYMGSPHGVRYYKGCHHESDYHRDGAGQW